MICRRDGGAFIKGRLAGFLLVGTSVSTALITGIAPLGAAADNGHGRGDRAQRNVVTTPSGKDPRDRPGDKLSVAGSTHNHGYQHTTANTAGGSSNVQNALCRHSEVCNITQHVTITGPRETAQPTPVPTVTVTVTATPTPTPTPVAPALTAPTPLPTPAPAPPMLCPVRLLLRVDSRVSVGPGLLGGFLSLSVIGNGTACRAVSGPNSPDMVRLNGPAEQSS